MKASVYSAPRVVVALDYPEPRAAEHLVDRLAPDLCRLKVGKELFVRGGPQLVEKFQRRGFEVFLDLKFHDIPNTVAQACRAAAELGVWMVDLHAQGGLAMMEAAREAVASASKPPLLIAVTVLTSHDQAALNELGISETPARLAARLAALTARAGLDGVVCSAQEARALRKAHGERFCLVTPGIRPQGSAQDDQKRVLTPAQASAEGSDYLVIGRPMTRTEDPVAVLEAITGEFAEAASR